MKKLAALLFTAFAFTAFLFADAPAFNDASAYVLDASTLPGSMKDNVKIINVSSKAANFDITVYAYDDATSGWLIFGKGHLKGLGDKATVKSLNKKLVKLGNYRYFAIKTSVDNPFRYSQAKGNNDLNVWIYDDRQIDESHFQVIDTQPMGHFKNKLQIKGGITLKGPASFKIYAYNDENEENKAQTIAIVTKTDDIDSYEYANNGIAFSAFRYFKIVSREEKDFQYGATIANNNLLITVQE